jgi:hypothetical protein
MQLRELIAKLDELDEDGIICVKRPWTAEAESVLAAPEENDAVPAAVTAAGFEHFLEVFIAREVMEVFKGKPPTLDEIIRLLIDYVETDAYPDWVYER